MLRAALAIVAIAGLQSLPAISDSIIQSRHSSHVTRRQTRAIPGIRGSDAPVARRLGRRRGYAAFLVENRPDAPMPPALGEIRVTIGSLRTTRSRTRVRRNRLRPWSSFGPRMTSLRSEAARSGDARQCRGLVPTLRPLKYLCRASRSEGASGTIELEQGETHRPDANGRDAPVSANRNRSDVDVFRFAYPPLDQATLGARAVPPTISLVPAWPSSRATLPAN